MTAPILPLAGPDDGAASSWMPADEPDEAPAERPTNGAAPSWMSEPTRAETEAATRRMVEQVPAERARLATDDPDGERGAVHPLLAPDAPLASVYELIEAGIEVRPPPQAVMERLGARPLGEVSTDPPPPLLDDRLDPEGHTILYGPGGAGKGALTAQWIVRRVAAGGVVLIHDYENHPGEWARRIHGLGGSEATAGVIHAAPLTAAWGGKRGSLWIQAEDVRALVAATGATYLVIDSIVPACAGADPLKPEAAALYAGALEYIGLPALSLAHATKAEDMRYPFGSAFWANLARTTWSLKRDGERAILAHRKHNNYASLGRFVVTMTWADDTLREVWEQGYTIVLSERIAETLGDEALTVAELVDGLNEDDDGEPVKANSVRVALGRGIKAQPQRFTVEGVGTTARYRRIA